MVFSAAMLKTVFHDDTDSMAIHFRIDGKLFNLRRLQAITKVKEEKMRNFMFADDYAVTVSSENEMQRDMDKCYVSLRCLWTQHQHKENRGHFSASTPNKLLKSNHHSEGPEASNCRPVHISRQYPVQECAYRRRG